MLEPCWPDFAAGPSLVPSAAQEVEDIAAERAERQRIMEFAASIAEKYDRTAAEAIRMVALCCPESPRSD